MATSDELKQQLAEVIRQRDELQRKHQKVVGANVKMQRTLTLKDQIIKVREHERNEMTCEANRLRFRNGEIDHHWEIAKEQRDEALDLLQRETDAHGATVAERDELKAELLRARADLANLCDKRDDLTEERDELQRLFNDRDTDCMRANADALSYMEQRDEAGKLIEQLAEALVVSGPSHCEMFVEQALVAYDKWKQS